MRSWVTQLRKGLLEFLVLSAIAEGETYGYQLIQRLKAIDALAVSESTVYPILERLRRDAYLRLRSEQSPNGPMRRYYSLSKLGENRLAEMDRHWDRLCASVESQRKKRNGGSHAKQCRQGNP